MIKESIYTMLVTIMIVDRFILFALRKEIQRTESLKRFNKAKNKIKKKYKIIDIWLDYVSYWIYVVNCEKNVMNKKKGGNWLRFKMIFINKMW